MANINGKYNMPGKLKRPERNIKKIAIISIAVIAFVGLSTWGTIHYMSKGNNDDGRGRRGQWHNANMPDPDKQTGKEILDYRNSDQFKQLSQQEQMMYSMRSGRQVMEYQMETYFTLPKEQKTAYLDKMIDEMQTMRKNFEQMRQQMPQRRPRDANDPNVQKRIAARQAAMSNPANARARSERGTALQQAQREQFGAAMRARMKDRGIQMPTGPGGGRGGFGGGPPGGR
jgi:hypothetical protein